MKKKRWVKFMHTMAVATLRYIQVRLSGGQASIFTPGFHGFYRNPDLRVSNAQHRLLKVSAHGSKA